MLKFMLKHNGPASMRYPKATLERVERKAAPVELGKAEVFDWGEDGAIVAFGSLFPVCMKAAEKLRAEGIHLAVINARFAKPLDGETLLKAVDRLTATLVAMQAPAK